MTLNSRATKASPVDRVANNSMVLVATVATSTGEETPTTTEVAEEVAVEVEVDIREEGTCNNSRRPTNQLSNINLISPRCKQETSLPCNRTCPDPTSLSNKSTNRPGHNSKLSHKSRLPNSISNNLLQLLTSMRRNNSLVTAFILKLRSCSVNNTLERSQVCCSTSALLISISC